MTRFAGSIAALLLAGCALGSPSPEAFVFGVMGDTPYNDREEAHYLKMMRRIDAEPLAFVIHVGDFKAGGDSVCSDALFARRKAQFDASKHPLVYTPGDNEWTDCRRASNGGMDPIERLARLRQIFFSDARSLGQERIPTQAQTECIADAGGACACPPVPENRMWTYSSVRFVTLNFPGKGNNEGYGAENDAEARCRTEANRAWLERAVAESERDNARALVIATQANPWVGRTKAYAALVSQVEDAARRLRRPVLFVHGDTHLYRADTPFIDGSGRPVANTQRLETYGSPFVGWVKVSVDPQRPEVFRFEPMLHAVVP
jgi:hypothetical protein